MAITPTTSRRAAEPKEQPDASRQIVRDERYIEQFPFGLLMSPPSRARYLASSLIAQRGYLLTEQMRRLGGWSVPGICVGTLAQQVSGLRWRIVNADGEYDDNTKYYGLLMKRANDGEGGFERLVFMWVIDILTCQTGAGIEIQRTYDGIPIALYNIDGATLYPTFDVEVPFIQTLNGLDAIEFEPFEVMQTVWRPYTEWQLRGYNLTPVQSAYNNINMLAYGDDYNQHAFTDNMPNGILNLGMGFDKDAALEWREVWRQELKNPEQNKISLLWQTEKIDFQAFTPSPKDMAFAETAFWYTTLVAAAFSLSVLDIGVGIQRVTTGAAAEQQSALSRRRGLRYILRVISKAIEHYVLPEDYKFEFEEIDSSEGRDNAAVAQMEGQTIGELMAAMGPEAGLLEAKAKGVLKSTKSMQAAIKWNQDKMQQEADLAERQIQARAGQGNSGGRDQTANTSSTTRDNGSNQP